MKILSTSILAAFATVAWPLVAAAENSVTLETDITYDDAEGYDVKLDLARPASDGSLPCLVLIHGGGWRQGNKSQLRELAKATAADGFVAVSVGYRLTPDHPFPAQVYDVKAAVRYLRQHADQYGIDPDRIAAMGFSAGGHLAMMLAVTDPDDGLEGDGGWSDQSSRVASAVSFFGPTVLDRGEIPEIVRTLLIDFLGGTRDENLEAYQQASPAEYVDESDPPMLLFQGTNDPLVPFQQAIEMLRVMDAAEIGGRVEFLVDANHGWGGEEFERTVEQSIRFIRDSFSSQAR